MVDVVSAVLGQRVVRLADAASLTITMLAGPSLNFAQAQRSFISAVVLAAVGVQYFLPGAGEGASWWANVSQTRMTVA